MDLKVSLDYVQTEESRYRKNAAIQIRQEVANVLKHARLPQKKRAQHQLLQLRKKQEKSRSRQDSRCQAGEESRGSQ